MDGMSSQAHAKVYQVGASCCINSIQSRVAVNVLFSHETVKNRKGENLEKTGRKGLHVPPRWEGSFGRVTRCCPGQEQANVIGVYPTSFGDTGRPKMVGCRKESCCRPTSIE
jgi:hypothetical protein